MQSGSAPTVTAVGTQTNGVATNRAIDVQFSTDMNPSTINTQTFLLTKVSDGSRVSGNVSYDATNKVGVFKPASDLASSTQYNAIITTGAADTAGHHLAKDYTFSFSTRANGDSSPIAVYSTTPSNGQTGVDVNTKIKVVFTEGADPSSVTIATFVVRDAAGNRIDGAVTYDIYNNVAMFYPNAPLSAGATYNVTIDGVRDLAGVPMKSPYTFTFTTAGGTSGGGSGGADLVYETDQLDDYVNGWSFDFDSGSLTQASGSPVVTDQGPYKLLASPNGKFLYVVMAQEQPTVRGSNCMNAPTEVISYGIDHSSGVLTLLQRLNLNGYCGGDQAALDPTGKYLYVGEIAQTVSGGMIDVVSLDSTTGKMAMVSGSPFAATSHVTHQITVAGNYLYAVEDQQGTTTGILIYQRDTSTGAVQFQSAYTYAPQEWIAALPSGTAIYTASMDSGQISEFKVDANTGNLTLQGTVNSAHNVFEIETDPTGKYAAAATQSGTFVYNTGGAGELTLMPGSPFGNNASAVMFDTTGTHFSTLEGRTSLAVYTLESGTARQSATTSLSNYPARVTMLSK